MVTKKELKDLDRMFHYERLMPGYINKKIFAGAIYLIIGLSLYTVMAEDLVTLNEKIYLECDNDKPCKNPFYGCDDPEIRAPTDSYELLSLPHNWEYCLQAQKIGCNKSFCDVEYIDPGQTLGESPGFIYSNFSMIAIIILILAGGLNHVYYKSQNRKKRRKS